MLLLLPPPPPDLEPFFLVPVAAFGERGPLGRIEAREEAALAWASTSKGLLFLSSLKRSVILLDGHSSSRKESSIETHPLASIELQDGAHSHIVQQRGFNKKEPTSQPHPEVRGGGENCSPIRVIEEVPNIPQKAGDDAVILQNVQDGL